MLRLRSVPKDGIISVVMQVSGLTGYFCTIDLSVRCRTLLGLADDVPKPEPEPEPEAGGSGGARGALGEMGTGEHADPGARLADVGLARGRAPRDGRPAAPDAHHHAGL